MKANPIGWCEIYVQDLNRAKKFYQDVFQNEFQPLVQEPQLKMWAFPMDMKTMGAGAALVWMEGFRSNGNGVIVYFTSEDCAIEEKRVVAAGGKVQKPKMSIGEYGFISLGVDTEGNIFGIHSQK